MKKLDRSHLVQLSDLRTVTPHALRARRDPPPPETIRVRHSHDLPFQNLRVRQKKRQRTYSEPGEEYLTRQLFL